MSVAPEIAEPVARGMSGSQSDPGVGPNSFVGYSLQKELPSAPADIVPGDLSFDADPEISTPAEPGIAAPAVLGYGIPARSCLR